MSNDSFSVMRDVRLDEDRKTVSAIAEKLLNVRLDEDRKTVSAIAEKLLNVSGNLLDDIRYCNARLKTAAVQAAKKKK